MERPFVAVGEGGSQLVVLPETVAVAVPQPETVAIASPHSGMVSIEPPGAVSASQESVFVISSGAQGVPGRDGAQSDSVYPSAGPVSAHRVVVIGDDGRLVYADAYDAETIWGIAGISSTAVSAADQLVQVRLFGKMSEPSWNWQPHKPIWLGANGAITQNPADDANLVELGVALTTTDIMIRIQQPIFLPE